MGSGSPGRDDRATADAVRALLESGVDQTRTNNNGSKPLQLAMLTTGRGGTGSAEAKEQQFEIVQACAHQNLNLNRSWVAAANRLR